MNVLDSAFDVAMVAGEASGDLLAAQLLRAMARRWPAWRSAGIGGSAMVAEGFRAWWPSDKLAVRGYIEVLRHYREIVGIRKRLLERLRVHPPRLFVGVDAPDFNLHLEERLRGMGVKTVHLVSPAFWAWRPERAQALRRQVDHVLCIFPFEPALLAQHGVPATYVGHPLAPLIPMEPDRAAARASLNLPPDAEVVALLPGSRKAEVDHLLPRFLKAARLMQLSRPALRFLLPAVPILQPQVEAMVRQHRMHESVRVTRGSSHTALAACDVTLIASGTATLEAALFKRPMVIAYHMNRLSWQITRRKRLQPWVGLPNILSGRFVVPELLQDAATPEALAKATLEWLQRDAAAQKRQADLQETFATLHRELTRDTAALACDAIEKVLAG